MFTTLPAAGLANANACSSQHGAANSWLAPSSVVTRGVPSGPLQAADSAPVEAQTTSTCVQDTMLAAQAAPDAGYLQMPATMLTLGGSLPASLPMMAAPIVAAPLASQIAAAVQPPVMHPNLVTTLRCIIDKPVNSQSSPPNADHKASCDQNVHKSKSLGFPRTASSSSQNHNLAASCKQEIDPLVQQCTSSLSSRGLKRSSDENARQEQESKIMRSAVLSSQPTFLTSASTAIQASGSPCPSTLPTYLSTTKSALPQRKGGRSAQVRSAEAANARTVELDVIHDRRPFKCKTAGCSKSFKNWQTLKMHLKTHDGAESAMSSSLEDSMTRWHGTGRAGQNKKIPSRCPVCQNTFVGLYELRRHFGRKHLQGEKPFACRKCNKRFFVEVDLRDHEKVCGESLQCHCGMRFAFKCNLVNHMRHRPGCQAAASRGHSPPSATLSSGSALPLNHPPVDVKPVGVSLLIRPSSAPELNSLGTGSFFTRSPETRQALSEQAQPPGIATDATTATLLSAVSGLNSAGSVRPSHESSIESQKCAELTPEVPNPGMPAASFAATSTSDLTSGISLGTLWSTKGGFQDAGLGSRDASAANPVAVQGMWTQSCGLSEPSLTVSQEELPCFSNFSESSAAGSSNSLLHTSFTLNLPSEISIDLAQPLPLEATVFQVATQPLDSLDQNGEQRGGVWKEVL